MGRIGAAALAALLFGASAAEAREIRLTGFIAGGSTLCAKTGCERTEENRPLSVFVVRTAGDIARVRHRGDIYSVDGDRVVVRLSGCSLKLKAYMAGTRCSTRR